MTAVNPRDLATLEQARSYISPNLTSLADDGLLQLLVTASSRWVESYLGRKLWLQAVTERRNGTGMPSIAASQYPIVSVQLVQFGATVLAAAPVTTENLSLWGYGWVQQDRYIYLRCGYFPLGTQNILLNYQAGYLTPGVLALAALPAWATATGYGVNAQVTAGGVLFTATTPGTSGATAPTWPTAVGQSVTDGTVTWLATSEYLAPVAGAQMLPEAINLACLELVAYAYRRRDRVGDTGTGLGPERVNYFTGAIPAPVKLTLDPYREVVPPWDVMAAS